jgi:hypothetical protein
MRKLFEETMRGNFLGNFRKLVFYFVNNYRGLRVSCPGNQPGFLLPSVRVGNQETSLASRVFGNNNLIGQLSEYSPSTHLELTEQR